MSYADNIGRIGALAVALGVGVALATTAPAIGHAAPGSTGDSRADTSSAATPSASGGPSTSSTSSARGLASSARGSRAVGPHSRPVRDTGAIVVVRSSGGAHTSTAGRRSLVSQTRVVSVGSQGLSVTGADAPDTTPVAAVAIGPSGPVPTSTADVVTAQPLPVAAVATTRALRARTPTLGLGVAAAPTPVEAAHTLVNAVSALVAAALDPLTSSGPHSPAPPSIALIAVLAEGVRREIEQTLHIQTGSAGIQQVDAQQAAVPAVESPNLLVNPGAEAGDPSLSGYASVTVPGWAVAGTPTVIQYGTLRRIPGLFGTMGPTLPACLGFPRSAPPGAGDQFFGGGNVATSSLTQTVDLSGAAGEIDNGTVPYTLRGDLGGYLLDPSRATVSVSFLDANQGWLASDQIGPVTALDRWLQTGLQQRETSGTIPEGTRSAKVVVTFTDCNPVLGNYNNAYADNLSFTVGANLPAPSPPAPPPSTVGALDHVFMVYMENHGVTDIVGSPNAPYLNSLLDAYGYAANYYALTHPSSPNYYPILGGSDFGTNYNCAADCFDQPNLADNIEAAGLTWAAYQQGGGGYSTPTDRTPFLAFGDIYNDPTRVAAHIFDLSQMGTDLASTTTAPNYVWFSADEASNMEGPIDSLGGILRFAFSQLTTHQYNVKAGDLYLRETVPVILDSAVWNDASQKSAIFLTFDEDYNNLSWGIGNQGNHIVMVVIPSPGAVAAGMRGGAFVANDYYNHYSLQRTIEDSLGLQPLTNNDKYAQPMNEFWT